MLANKRRRRFVDAKLQGAVIRQSLSHWALYSGTAFAVLLCVHYVTRDTDQPASAILSEMWNRYSLLVYVLAALLPGFVLDLVKLTHRFAGPMIRFRRALDDAKEGKPVAPLRFREGDFWGDLAEKFNGVLARIDELEAALAERRDFGSLEAPQKSFETRVIVPAEAVGSLQVQSTTSGGAHAR